MPADADPPNTLKVVLCWHMHQPDYRDGDGYYQQPWCYLRGIKDYTDMAAHLEQNENARAVVNFAPILLEQLHDYGERIERFSREENRSDPLSLLHDPVLASLATENMPAEDAEREQIIHWCLRIQRHHFVERFPIFADLVAHSESLLERPERLAYVREQLFADLLTWYHLAWFGETVKRGDERIHRLIEQGRHYSWEQRRELVAIIGETLRAIPQRYRALADQGRVELSMTPYAHPIAPLMFDLYSARQAEPELPLPEAPTYPGGAGRLRWHVDRGINLFEQVFGSRPAGCWPAEGAVDDASIDLLQGCGFRWAASGANVLHKTLAHQYDSAAPKAHCHRYQFRETDFSCFFRDDELSDLIGFQYSDWHADDAVGDLIHRMEQIHHQCDDNPDAMVAIIMDGENAWEHYPNNGYYFLQGLYAHLADHVKMELTTFSRCCELEPQHLPPLVAGSWVYGTLTTWIGNQDKNRAWDMLVEAKQAFDRVIATDRLNAGQRDAAERQLAVCEGSDWFWWFGDHNSAPTIAEFDRLYRLQLRVLYQSLGEAPPDYLDAPFTHEHATAEPAKGGVMRRANE